VATKSREITKARRWRDPTLGEILYWGTQAAKDRSVVEQVSVINFKRPEDGVGRMVAVDCEVEPDERIGTPVEKPRWQS